MIMPVLIVTSKGPFLIFSVVKPKMDATDIPRKLPKNEEAKTYQIVVRMPRKGKRKAPSSLQRRRTVARRESVTRVVGRSSYGGGTSSSSLPARSPFFDSSSGSDGIGA